MKNPRNQPGKFLFIFFLVISFTFMGALKCEASNKKKKQPNQIQPPSTSAPLMVWGKVSLWGKTPVPGVIIELVPVLRSQVRSNIPAPVTTKNNGTYSFTVSPDFKGKKFRIIPKHPAFPPYQKFKPAGSGLSLQVNPADFEFVLNGNHKFDLDFQAAPMSVSGYLKTGSNHQLKEGETVLEKGNLLGNYVQVQSKTGKYYNFEIQYTDYGKLFRIRPRHRIDGTWGKGFSPGFIKFKAKVKNQNNDFIYKGALPDYVITGITLKSESHAIVHVKNIGILGSDKVMVRITWKEKNKENGKETPGHFDTFINGLAPGASADVSMGPFYTSSKIHFKFSFANVNMDHMVTESNFNNNTTPYN